MRSAAGLALLLLAGCASVQAPARLGGSISGKIAYPSEFAPAMRICALRDDSAAPVCTHTAAGATNYQLVRLPAGEYRVIAQLHEADMRVGGHVQQVQCIRAPCPALLQAVTVSPGGQVTEVDLNEFYAAREDFPALPEEVH